MIAVLFFLALFLLVMLFKYISSVSKILVLRPYEKSLRVEIKNTLDRLAVMSKLNKKEFKKELDRLNKKFPKKEEIPIILDRLEQLGKNTGVEITSIGKQSLKPPVAIDVKVKGVSYKFSYQPLSLTINLTSSYIKLAEFLEALDNWAEGIVVVKSFIIQRDELTYEKLMVDGLVIEITTIEDGNK